MNNTVWGQGLRVEVKIDGKILFSLNNVTQSEKMRKHWTPNHLSNLLSFPFPGI